MKIQSELAATTLEGYSEDETVCVTMSGNQARIVVPRRVLTRSGNRAACAHSTIHSACAVTAPT